MNFAALEKTPYVKEAKAFLSLGQHQLSKAADLYKAHGKALLLEGKSFYSDLLALQKKSIKEAQKILNGSAQKSMKGKSTKTTTKKANAKSKTTKRAVTRKSLTASKKTTQKQSA